MRLLKVRRIKAGISQRRLALLAKVRVSRLVRAERSRCVLNGRERRRIDKTLTRLGRFWRTRG